MKALRSRLVTSMLVLVVILVLAGCGGLGWILRLSDLTYKSSDGTTISTSVEFGNTNSTYAK